MLRRESSGDAETIVRSRAEGQGMVAVEQTCAIDHGIMADKDSGKLDSHEQRMLQPVSGLVAALFVASNRPQFCSHEGVSTSQR
jgi:hypothetical protein